MIEFLGQCVLLDIEGTTSSVSFVYDVMFPFVRRELHGYLRRNWQADELQSACRQLAQDQGLPSLDAWWGDAPPAEQQRLVAGEALRLMDADAKTTGLKQLQGQIWRAGFASGELVAHVYDDVVPALSAWQHAGIQVRVYSSGSVQAQKLFFGHSARGNLLPFFRGHYDTTIGSKREAASYERIAADSGLSPAEILFISDITAELDAARTAGLQTALCRRPGNADPGIHSHAEIRSFAEIACRT